MTTIEFLEAGTFAIATKKDFVGCRYCRIGSYDIDKLKAHVKTKEHLEKKKQNPNAKPLSEDDQFKVTRI